MTLVHKRQMIGETSFKFLDDKADEIAAMLWELMQAQTSTKQEEEARQI